MLDKEEYSNEETVESWVMEKCNHWRDHFTNNYEEKFDEYNRLWRGHFSEEDKTRNSERSKIISLPYNKRLNRLLLRLKKPLLVVENSLIFVMICLMNNLKT